MNEKHCIFDTKDAQDTIKIVFENKIGHKLPNFEVEVSFSHEKDYVVAFVIISKNY